MTPRDSQEHTLGGCREPDSADVRIGYVTLTDCAVLAVAKERGIFSSYGLDVSLLREPSWANIRDKVIAGLLDAAQMLAPMPLAATMGVGSVREPMITALSLDLNGNAITVSNALHDEMSAAFGGPFVGAFEAAKALRLAIDRRLAEGRKPPVFAHVFPFSSHHYELRYWMASAGIVPDHDVQLVVVPPQQMMDSLSSGHIDGYCVGEPWNEWAVREEIGRTVATKYEIWNNSPEKVLGVRSTWAEEQPCTHKALVKALIEAARWADVAANRREVVNILVDNGYVRAPRDVVMMSMTGSYSYVLGEAPRTLPDFNVFHRYAANFPWRSHALWFLTQMRRWGHIPDSVDIRHIATSVYRPDIYRVAASELGVVAPDDDWKSEGEHPGAWQLPTASGPIAMGPDSFLDGRVFDPRDPDAYLRGFARADRVSG